MSSRFFDLRAAFSSDPAIYKSAPEYFVKFQLHDMYEIGSLGTIKSKYMRKVNTSKGVLGGYKKSDGYKYFWLKYYDNGIEKERWFYGHILVAMHFVANPYHLKEVDHLDNIRDNNAWWNLNWTTHAQNCLNTITRDGRTYPKGKDHWRTGVVLTDKQKERLGDMKTGILHPRFKGFYWVKGIRYDSSIAAAKATGLCYKTIIRKCKASSDPYSNFYFESTEGFDLDAWL